MVQKGIKTTPEGDKCAYCDAKVNTAVYNYCPKCANPLNFDALRRNEQLNKKIKLEILDELSLQIDDAKSLQIILNKIKSL
ncbi:MAG: hypothetical protein IJ318_02480 [Clostridia bacterium]|nr:hypothetical protein [Clostridia bacterium]